MTVTRTRSNYEFYKQSIQERDQEAVEDDPAGTYFFPDRKQKMRAVVTYQVDYEKVWRYADTIEDEDELQKFYENYPRVKVEDVTEFLKDERVKMANSISSNMWYSDENNSLDFVHLGNTREENMDDTGQSCWYDESGAMQCETYKEPIFFVKSNMYPGMIEFEDGDYQIVSGRFYNQDEIDNGSMVCVISRILLKSSVSIPITIR